MSNNESNPIETEINQLLKGLKAARKASVGSFQQAKKGSPVKSAITVLKQWVENDRAGRAAFSMTRGALRSAQLPASDSDVKEALMADEGRFFAAFHEAFEDFYRLVGKLVGVDYDALMAGRISGEEEEESVKELSPRQQILNAIDDAVKAGEKDKAMSLMEELANLE